MEAPVPHRPFPIRRSTSLYRTSSAPPEPATLLVPTAMMTKIFLPKTIPSTGDKIDRRQNYKRPSQLCSSLPPGKCRGLRLNLSLKQSPGKRSEDSSVTSVTSAAAPPLGGRVDPRPRRPSSSTRARFSARLARRRGPSPPPVRSSTTRCSRGRRPPESARTRTHQTRRPTR